MFLACFSCFSASTVGAHLLMNLFEGVIAISAPTRTHYPLTVGTRTMTSHVLPSKKKVSVVAFTAAVCLSSLPQFAHSFVQVTPAMSSASRYSPTRLDRTGGRPAPFVTVSSSGSTIESALGSLGSLVRHEMGDGLHLQGRPRCEIGVLFYTQREAGDVREPHGGGNGVEDALVGFHSCLPFIDQIIGERVVLSRAEPHRWCITVQVCYVPRAHTKFNSPLVWPIIGDVLTVVRYFERSIVLVERISYHSTLCVLLRHDVRTDAMEYNGHTQG